MVLKDQMKYSGEHSKCSHDNEVSSKKSKRLLCQSSPDFYMKVEAQRPVFRLLSASESDPFVFSLGVDGIFIRVRSFCQKNLWFFALHFRGSVKIAFLRRPTKRFGEASLKMGRQ